MLRASIAKPGAAGEPADNVGSICFSSLITFDLVSLREISFHCEIVLTANKCVVSQCGRIIYCAFSEDYKARNLF